MDFPEKDRKGYWRGDLEHSTLISRKIAFEKIYLKNREMYPLKFRQYVIHHRDRDKDNNSVKNLDIVTKEEHHEIHRLELEGKKELGLYKSRVANQKRLKELNEEIPFNNRIGNYPVNTLHQSIKEDLSGSIRKYFKIQATKYSRIQISLKSIFSNFFILHGLSLIVFWMIIWFLLYKLFNPDPYDSYFTSLSDFLSPLGWTVLIPIITGYFLFVGRWIESIRQRQI